MATALERDFRVPLSPEALSATMRDVGLIEDSERSRGALEVEVKDLVRNDTRHEYEIRVVNHARSIKGLDTSKTETSYVTVRWDLPAGRRSWTWRGDHRQVEITGSDRIVSDQGGCRLEMNASIRVSIPLAGKMIEKKIRAGFEESWPQYIELVKKHASTAQ
jgi:hypothetical protein